MTQHKYTETRISDDQQELAGVWFDDPYQWLESETEEVKRWQNAQNAFAQAHIENWPAFESLLKAVTRLSAPRPERTGLIPRFAGGLWFRVELGRGARVIAAPEPMGDGRTIFDTAASAPDASPAPFISWISPSPNGEILALGLCLDGSENNFIRLIDTASGHSIVGAPSLAVMDAWTGGANWLPDSSGFFFSAIGDDPRKFEQSVYLYRVERRETSHMEVPWMQERDYRMVVASPDGRRAVAIEGLIRPRPIAVATLSDGAVSWAPFITTIDAMVAGHIVGDSYIAVTDLDAARGRLVSIALDSENPNDARRWAELVPETDATLRGVTPVGRCLYLTEFEDTYSRVRIVGLDGTPLGEIPLPGRGAISELSFLISNLAPKNYADQYVFSFSTLTTSPGFYSHEPGSLEIEILRAPAIELENCVVEDRSIPYVSDTRLHYHIVRRANVSSSGPVPTLIYAYGGFNVPLIPQFPGAAAAFVEAGGVFVHAHLPGGGEFGRDWWELGRLKNKRHCFDALYRLAEHLIAEGLCTPKTLALTGRSNGGLLAGLAAVERPDLWKVVVPQVPLLDLIGACRDPYDRMAVAMDYADVSDPVEVRRLAAFSPYHQVREGVAYPAMLLDAGGTDPRCPPWHARKFAACVQRATSAANPILVRVWGNAGHGWATDMHTSTRQSAAWLAFIMRELSMIRDEAELTIGQ